ncbi:xanthine dehydrogenase subunit XdhA [Leclercia adecarboxylata]|uniref:Xanthine dehydrogenase subunit XdhA n=1 Tax=Leclercia adecarboxylata TaxID=83655 RepID=A0A4U9HLV9_9ENTR|nr:xanthine dehydrogenase subunit XdhA [Leclercia adecarboxylata]
MPTRSAGKARNATPGQVRDGRWLVGMGMAAGFRNNLLEKSAARVHLDAAGNVTVETDMTDIGTGSYTIIAQTAAEMLGVPLEKVTVNLGDSSFPGIGRFRRAMGGEHLHLGSLCRLREVA